VVLVACARRGDDGTIYLWADAFLAETEQVSENDDGTVTVTYHSAPPSDGQKKFVPVVDSWKLADEVDTILQKDGFQAPDFWQPMAEADIEQVMRPLELAPTRYSVTEGGSFWSHWGAILAGPDGSDM
jgi:hypothetical protein